MLLSVVIYLFVNYLRTSGRMLETHSLVPRSQLQNYSKILTLVACINFRYPLNRISASCGIPFPNSFSRTRIKSGVFTLERSTTLHTTPSKIPNHIAFSSCRNLRFESIPKPLLVNYLYKESPILKIPRKSNFKIDKSSGSIKLKGEVS